MGKMYTLQSDESINDHAKESVSLLNRLAEIAKEAYKYLPEKDCTLETGVFLDVDSRTFYSAIEHIRESIQMLDELCDELEDDKDEIRHEYEEKVVQFFNRFMNADLTDETNYRTGELTRLVHQLDNQVGKLNKELEQEREHSNQLEAQVKVLNAERDLAKQKSEELKRKLNEKYGTDVAYSGYFDTDITHMYPKTTLKPNNPANFCGNCRHYAQMGKDDGDFEGICTQHYIKRVDPDDASCSHFKSNKPDHEVCDNCDKECDDCGYYPF